MGRDEEMTRGREERKRDAGDIKDKIRRLHERDKVAETNSTRSRNKECYGVWYN